MKNPLHIFSVLSLSNGLLCALCALCGLTVSAQTPLKQSTAATVQIGPAVDASDGNTEVADLTTTELEISKAGGIFAALNGSATLTHDDDGFYRLALTASDTDTLGLLRVKVIDATAMSFAEDFLILPTNTFDSLYAGTDYLQTDVTQVSGSAAASDTTLETKIDTIDTVVDAILVDTGTTLPTTLATIDSNVDAVLVDTGTTLPATLGTPTDTDLATDIANIGTVGSAGSGAYTITTTVTDGTNPLENATVRVSEGVSTYSASTDVNGEAAFALDAATYSVAVTKSGYQFTPTTRTVTGEETGTLTTDLALSQVTVPSAPADANLCTVYAYLQDLLGADASGVVVTFELSSGFAKAGSIIQRGPQPATSDVNGYVEIDLIRTDAMTPSNRVYYVTCIELGFQRKQVTLTDTTYDLATLIE